MCFSNAKDRFPPGCGLEASNLHRFRTIEIHRLLQSALRLQYLPNTSQVRPRATISIRNWPQFSFGGNLVLPNSNECPCVRDMQHLSHVLQQCQRPFPNWMRSGGIVSALSESTGFCNRHSVCSICPTPFESYPAQPFPSGIGRH